MIRIILLLGVFALCIALLFQASPVDADATVIFDFAEMLDDEAKARTRQILADLARDKKVPVAVIAIESPQQAERGFTDLSSFTASVIQRSAYYDTMRGYEFQAGIVVVVSRSDPMPAFAFGSGWSKEQAGGFVTEISERISSACPRGSCTHAAKLALSVEQLDRSVRMTEAPLISYAGKFVRIWRLSINTFIEVGKDPWTALGYFKWVLIFFVAWELVRPWRRKQRKLRDGIWLDVFYTFFVSVLFMAIIGTAVCEVSNLMFRDFLFRFFGVRNMVAIELNSWPLWVRYALMILLFDLIGYWVHRWLHQSDTLWEFHKIHHSSKQLDVFNAIKLHFVEDLLFRSMFYIPMGVIGFAAGDAFIVTIFRSLLSMFTHANVKIPLGPLKYVLNSPQMHIWHHAANHHERGNVNFGDALSMWDFVFGTAYLSDDSDKLELGFEGDENYPTTFWGQLVVPFKAILSSKK